MPPAWLPLGKHRYYVEGDLFVMEGHGEMSLEEVKQIFAVCWQLGERYGYWLVLFDARAGATMNAEARRYTAEAGPGPGPGPGPGHNKKHLSSTGIFGAGPAERTFATLIRGAIRLLQGTEVPISLYKHEDEARAWLDEQRQHYRTQLGISRAGSV